MPNIQLATQAGSTGILNIGAGGGAGFIVHANIAGTGSTISAGSGNAILNFNHTDINYEFSSAISGNVNVNHVGAGSTVFTGNKAYSGDTAINAGTMVLSGNLTNANNLVTVNNSGTLHAQGNRSISGGVTVASGGRLVVGEGSANTLTIGGPGLTLAAGATLVLDLGLDGDNLPVGDLITVNGDVSINGAQLEVANLGNFGSGTWTLINFGGNTINGGWSFADAILPDGLNGEIRLNEDGNAIILVVGGEVLEDSFWGPGAVFGGDGVWDNATPNWTDENEAVQVAWGEQNAIFGGVGGEVTVEGEVRFTAMRFDVDGYRLVAGTDAALLANEDVLAAQAPVIEVVGSDTTATLDLLLDAGARPNALRKTGEGTLVLARDQTYTGTTTVQEGRLHLGEGGGSGMVDGAVVVQNAGTLVFHRGDDVTFSHVISGSGRVEQIGNGTTVLMGANSWTGATVITAGTLQVGNGGSTGTLGAGTGSIDIGAAGQLVVNRANNLTLGGALSGSGELVQMGGGTLTLSGNSASFAGTTRLDHGGLTVSGTLGGDISAAADTTLQVSGTVGGDVTAAQASLLVSGTVAGDVSAQDMSVQVNGGTIGGSVSITGGSLQLSGEVGGAVDLVSSQMLLAGSVGGAVDVRSGSELTGSGSIGGATIWSGGLLRLATVTADSNPNGPTLTVDGDLTLREGAELQLGVNRLGDADWLHVTGSVELGGAVLALAAGSPTATWQAFNEYLVLVADGGISGDFDEVGVSADFAFLEPRLERDAMAVTLHLDRNDVRFGELDGLTANQQTMGMALQGMEGLANRDIEHPVVQGLLPLSVDQARTALGQLSGEFHASLRSVLLGDGGLLRDVVMAHAGSAANPGSRFWTRGLYHDGDFEGDDVTSLERSTAGLLVGADYLMGSHGFTLGWAVGYHRSEVEAASLGAASDVDSVHLAAYSSARWAMRDLLPMTLPGDGSLGVRFGVAQSWHEVTASRTVAFLGESLLAEYDVSSQQVFAEVDYRFEHGELQLSPFLGVAWSRLDAEGFNEVARKTAPAPLGETAALQGDAGVDHLTTLTLGARGTLPWGERLKLSGMAGWRHVLSGDRLDAGLRLRDSDPAVGFMSMGGVPLAENALVTDLGLSLALGEDGLLGLSWAGQMGSDVTDNALHLRFEWRLD